MVQRETETDKFLAMSKRDDAPTTPILRGKSAELASIEHRPRMCNIWIFLIVVTSFSLESNYVLQYLNQMKTFLRINLDWGDAESQKTIWFY